MRHEFAAGLAGLAAILAVGALFHSATATTVADPPTTDGVIALSNLNAQVAGLEGLLGHGGANFELLPQLGELLLQRGFITGRISDYERAEVIAADAVAKLPGSKQAFLLRARVHARFHRFPSAMADIDQAEAAGASPAVCAAMRASIDQALGRYDQALAVRSAQHRSAVTMATSGALASLQAERGEAAAASALFAEARARYRDVSPFPLASTLFDEGRMWMDADNWPRARDCLAEAVRMLPGFVPAVGHLAEVEAKLGHTERARRLLESIATGSDDPDYLGQLARLTHNPLHFEQATALYDALVARYPEAFSDHAAELALDRSDFRRAWRFAEINLRVRQTPRAYELAIRAAAAEATVQQPVLCRQAKAKFGAAALDQLCG